MFDKNKFAQILKNINETYNSQRDFSKKSEINRTYLSQYMNMKLDDPPKPKILDKLAKASNGLISYEDLMKICGYINNDLNDDKILDLYNMLNELEDYYTKTDRKIQLKVKELEVESVLFKQFIGETFSHQVDKKDIEKSLNDFDFISAKSKQRILDSLKNSLDYFYYKKVIKNSIRQSTSNLTNDENKYTYNSHIRAKSQYYMCPVYGQISAGQPNWAEECIDGRIPIDPDLMGIVNPEEHFFLKVNGESMNNVIKNGAFALIHKQDIVEDGEIAVVLVNGYDATLKRFTKKGDVIVLEPDSTDSSFKMQIYDKTTPIKILGKYVGKMEINK